MLHPTLICLIVSKYNFNYFSDFIYYVGVLPKYKYIQHDLLKDAMPVSFDQNCLNLTLINT